MRVPQPITSPAIREAIVQALAEALVASWRRDHPESALHSRAS